MGFVRFLDGIENTNRPTNRAGRINQAIRTGLHAVQPVARSQVKRDGIPFLRETSTHRDPRIRQRHSDRDVGLRVGYVNLVYRFVGGVELPVRRIELSVMGD